ncbi:MAG TPA: nuclear transport factor 2 family protein [Egibacteraceae bacterium]|nr:nuclear transport factor 2 family protein [Egibacteraceae bacterium]
MTVDRAAAARWLDGYVEAWRSADPGAIGELFSADAAYYPEPYTAPLEGREAIVAAWVGEQDPPNSWAARYEPVAVEGDVAVATGITRYFDEGGAERARYHNVFLLHFDSAGRCSEYREWWMAEDLT